MANCQLQRLTWCQTGDEISCEGESYRERIAKAALGSTGCIAAMGNRPAMRSLQPIVWRFFRDNHIMHMRLSEARRSDANKLALVLKLLDSLAPRVAHP